MILSTPSCSDSALPTSPPPGTTCRTSAGSTWLSTWIRPSTDSGVYSEGLTTTVLPMRSEAATCHTVIIMGQFHGPIAPTTPSGT